MVFADEPTGALDRTTGDQVMGVLLDTVAELDAALVVVTHDPRIAARCTRTIEIRDGRLSGTPRTGDGERPGFDGFAGRGATRAGPALSAPNDAVESPVGIRRRPRRPGVRVGPRLGAGGPLGPVGRGADAFAPRTGPFPVDGGTDAVAAGRRPAGPSARGGGAFAPLPARPGDGWAGSGGPGRHLGRAGRRRLGSAPASPARGGGLEMTELAWRLTRLGGRSALLSTGLTALAVAVATLLLQFAVAGNFAFDERGERTSWREPAPAAGAAEAIIATAADHFGGHTITRVDLAAIGDDAPVPPGMDAFPAPGEVWLSPAAADLLEGVPNPDFLARYGDVQVAGELGPEGARAPERARGRGRPRRRRSGDDRRTVQRRRRCPPWSSTTFEGGSADSVYGFYMILMILAAILMAVPAAVFGAAAARLTVSRRDERLATLRLIGATPGQVMRLTLIETTLAAAAGRGRGNAGVDGGDAAGRAHPDRRRPLVCRATCGPGRRGWLAVAVAVPALVAVSALIGLRGVVISPLGVARRVKTKGLKAIRLVVFACASGGVRGRHERGRRRHDRRGDPHLPVRARPSRP